MQKIKNIFIILILLILLFVIFQNISLASKNVSRYFGAEKVTESNGETIGYGITFPGIKGKIIHTIKEHESKEEDSAVISNYPTVYCLKAEKGFDHPGAIDEYDIEYNMLEEKEEISRHNEETYQLVNRGLDKIIALLNVMYVPGKSSEEYKQKLLEASRKKFQVEYTNLISDTEIHAVNQAVLWKYTNPEDIKIYNNYNVDEWLSYSNNGSTYHFLSEYKPETGEGLDRKNQMEALYKYLMDIAEGQIIDGESANDTCVVQKDEIEVREKPGKMANVITTVEKDTIVTRIVKEVSYVDGVFWDKIILEDDTEGYVESEGIKTDSINEKCEVKTYNQGDKISLRENPTAASNRIKYIEDGTKITRIEKDVAEAQIYLWDKVQLEDGTIGYVASQYVKPDTEQENQAYKIKTFTKGDIVRVRQEPNTSSNILAKSVDGDIIKREETRVAFSNDYIWDKISLSDGTVGYVPTQYVQPTNRIKEYDIYNVVKKPIEVNQDTPLNYELKDNNYILGPINIIKNNQTLCDVTMTLKKNGSSIDYVLLDNQKSETTKDKIENGGEYYILVPATEVNNNMSIEISTKYEETQSQLIASTKDNSLQILAEPYKETKQESTEIDVKMFDLALREYITQINGKNLEETRVPQIDNSTLNSGTTATYNHTKKPVEIYKGDEITLNYTIYNEGKQKGSATEITSILPQEIEFLSVETKDYTASYDKSNNKLLLQKNGNNSIEGFIGDEMSSETITIKCKVKNSIELQEDKALTSVAWISKEYNQDTNQEITSQKGLDRDSEPETIPNITENNIEEYKGGIREDGSENKDVNEDDSNYYWVGQQDDDDFEKILLKYEEEQQPPATQEPTKENPIEQEDTKQEPTKHIENKEVKSNYIPKAGKISIPIIILVLIINIAIAYKKYKGQIK